MARDHPAPAFCTPKLYGKTIAAARNASRPACCRTALEELLERARRAPPAQWHAAAPRGSAPPDHLGLRADHKVSSRSLSAAGAARLRWLQLVQRASIQQCLQLMLCHALLAQPLRARPRLECR